MKFYRKTDNIIKVKFKLNHLPDREFYINNINDFKAVLCQSSGGSFLYQDVTLNMNY